MDFWITGHLVIGVVPGEGLANSAGIALPSVLCMCV